MELRDSTVSQTSKWTQVVHTSKRHYPPNVAKRWHRMANRAADLCKCC
jgi:hypothetical protein